jgi:hypothetical protein
VSLSKKIRFEVFKRDSFTCQYCGRKAPDVILHADHIHPKAEGGTDDVLNLVTSCRDCNLGKGPRTLDDHATVERRRSQLEELQERQEQIGMMVEWQRSLVDLDAQAVGHAARFWCDMVDWRGVNESGTTLLRKWIRKYSLEEVLTAMRRAYENYVTRDDDGSVVPGSANAAFHKVPSICHFCRDERERPWMKDVFYVRGVLRNRLNYYNPWESRELLEVAFSWGGERQDLYKIAVECSSWTNFRNRITEYIEELQGRAAFGGGEG